MKRYILSLAAITLMGVAVAYATCLPPGSPISPDGTTIPPAAKIIDPSGSTWTVTPTNEVLWNTADTGVTSSSLAILNGGIIYDKDTMSVWHQWVGWEASADPNSYTQPATITASFLSTNFRQTLNDSFASGQPTIAPNGSSTFNSSYTWYNGVEQCCMSPTVQPGNNGGAMYPTAVRINGPVNTISNAVSPDTGMYFTIAEQTDQGGSSDPTCTTCPFTTIFSNVITSIASNKQGFLQQYGYFEITMWVPGNVGSWPAFWMLSPSKNMEIDIIEYYGQNGHNANHYFFTSHDYGNNILYGPNESTGTVNLSTGYHTFGVLIDAGNMTFYQDRQKMGTTTTPAGAKQPMYLLIDNGVGGGWPTTDAGLNGQLLKVSNVSVWQHN